MKIGLISDTHSAGSGRDLPTAVFDALAGCELVLHCGDLECIGVLDYLEELAPVLAVRGYEDPVEVGERLARVSRVVEVAGIRIGMVHDIQWPTPSIATTPDGTGLVWPESGLGGLLQNKFGGEVDMVVFGDTHEEMVEWREGVLFVNPGSPTYPGRRHRPGSLGTVAILDINDGEIKARIVNLAPESDGHLN
ncbi:MAG: metallophosphoesterase family protein [Chloroflexota bacterium]|nr:metallophosphoesterase family protein [Chloroflexota bacterium]MDE2961908.1 metallophosphoesterase family protein [Chloroflexota bacterium]